MALSRITANSIADGTVVAADIADGTVTNTKLAGSITSDKITSVSNTAISGLIQAAQIGSVSNTALSGLIQAAQIGSANASVINAGTLAGARLPAGSVLQVVQQIFSSDIVMSAYSTGTWTDTGISLSITPSLASSKILIIADIGCYFGNDSAGFGIQFVRDSTAIWNDTENYANYFRPAGSGTIENRVTNSYSYLDSPNSTSSTAYKIYVDRHNGTVQLNNGNSTKIILMEIAA
jgi:hypothetical protein